MEKNDKLEERMVREFFTNLDRALCCPHQMCEELGKHFRCYNLDYEQCDKYLEFTTSKYYKGL